MELLKKILDVIIQLFKEKNKNTAKKSIELSNKEKEKTIIKQRLNELNEKKSNIDNDNFFND